MSPTVGPLEILQARPRISGNRLGRIVDLRRRPFVDFDDNPLGPQPARVVSSVSLETVATAYRAQLPVLLAFDSADPGRPIIIGVVTDDLPTSAEAEAATDARAPVEEENDGKQHSISLVLATIIEVDGEAVLVHTEDTPEHKIRAKTTIALRNLRDPIVMVRADHEWVIVGQMYPSPLVDAAHATGSDVVLRGETVTIEASARLILKAGSCEIKLDPRGKASIAADTIVSRARGANKIQGGSVQLN